MNGRQRCARCGLEREARATSVLCRDCRYVLSTAEAMLWIEKKKEKVAA